MSTHSGPSPTAPMSAVRNTAGQGKEISQGNPNGPASDAALREYYDNHYNSLLSILAEKMHQEKLQQAKLKAVKARLNFEEVLQHSESGTLSRIRDLRKRLRSKRTNSRKDTESRYQSSHSRRIEPASKKHHSRKASTRKTKVLSESEDSAGGHWKSRSKKQRSSIEDDNLSQSWTCYFKSPISKMFDERAKVEWKAGKLEQEAEYAFKQMKQLITIIPTFTTPEEKEELIVYLAAAKEAVSAVLMTEREAKQMAIYFVSRALRGPEVNYTSMEKLVLALVHASKHFIVERPEEDSPDTPMEVEEELPEPWILFTDGSGAGLILTNPEREEFTYALRFMFEATNNEAEYEALIAGLRIAEEMGVKNLQENVDFRLVANQVNGTYIAKEADKIRYLEKARTLTNGFIMFSIKEVPTSENKKACTSFAHLRKQVLVEELREKLINELEVLKVIEEKGDTWMTPIYEYLTEESLPAEVKKARAAR
nr:hypothetical protein [Tanacetum cinerariifolium]